MNILNKIKWFFNSVMFSLKKADTEMLSQNSNYLDVNSGVYQEINSERVAHHLLKGEITQEVVDLRYRDYTIADEARNFKYTGNGRGIKHSNNSNATKFTVVNKDKTLSILDSISFDKKYEDIYTINLKYKIIPRFKLEKSCNILDVDMDNSTLIFHFSKFYNVYNQDKPFKNELKKLLENPINLNRHEFNDIENVSFTTFEVKGIKNYLTYNFRDLTLLSIKEINNEYLLEYMFDTWDIKDLTAEFYSHDMAQKYIKKEARQIKNKFEEEQKYETCEICGQPIKEIMDENVTKTFTEKRICHSCLYKIIVEKEKKE